MSTAPTLIELGMPGPVGRALAQSLSAGRIAPAYLLEGVDAESLTQLANRFAAALVAEPGTEVTHAALERVESGAHHDVHRITRDKPTVISVAALDQHLERAHQRPLESPRQVFIVDPADALEPEGVARYLKTLEEPPASTVFLLLTVRPDRLPATVASRCQSVRVPSWDEARVRAHLAEGIFDATPEDQAAIEIAAHLASGAPSRAAWLFKHEVPGLLDAFVAQATARPARVSEAATRLLAALDTILPAGRPKTQARAEVLGDVLHALSVDVRDAAAGRPARWAGGLSPERALDCFTALGAFAGALRLHVPAVVVLIEVARWLRDEA